jgi:hypothetical protein
MEALTLVWPGGEDDFLLRLGELEALDDKTPDGVLDLRYRLSLGQERGSLAYAPVRVREVLDCLRLGLIGGGMDGKLAKRKVQRAFENGDMAELCLAAYTVISHAFAGKAHDPVGDAASGEERAEGNPPESSSPASTETGS